MDPQQGRAAVLAPPAPGAVTRPGERTRQVAGSARDAVRSDLAEVFRRDPLVVAVAARVLGARDQAEDVAQEVFLSFGRSAVSADEARGWLSVAAAHTALNLLRPARRRAVREDVVALRPDAVVPDVADACSAPRGWPGSSAGSVPAAQRGGRPRRLGLPGATADGRPRARRDARLPGPSALVEFGRGNEEAGAFPFLSLTALTPGYLLWAVFWVAMVWGVAAMSFGRKDL